MNVFRIRKLELGSFIRVSVAIAAALGLIFALVVLIGTLLGLGDAFFDFGFVKVTGIVPAILGIFVMPVVFGLGSLLTAPILYLPFNWFLPLLGGIRSK